MSSLASLILWPAAEILASRASLLPALQRLSPQIAVLLATAGLVLIAWELNRPGMILPGTLGLLAVLFAAAALAAYPLRAVGLLLLFAALLLIALNLWARLPVWLLAATTATLIAGIRVLVKAPASRVPLWCALLCGGLLGGGGAVLSRIALRARRAKAVN